MMYGYTVVGGFSGATWNPYGRPAPVDAGIGGGTPLRVQIDEPRRVAVRGETVVEVPVSRTVSEIKPVARRTEQVLAKDAVIVPSPSGGATSESEDAIVVPSPVCVTGASGSTACK